MRDTGLGKPALRAIVFDIDGTLYRQPALRRAMFVRLVRVHLPHPLRGWRNARILQAYRRAQEQLRSTTDAGDLTQAQIRVACRLTGADEASVVECVNRWIEQEPLAFLPRCEQPGGKHFLEACQARGLRLGALSDYPAEQKLQALGLRDLFDVVLDAQSTEVGVFKPNPKGLLTTLERLGTHPSEALYVGDRADVDAPTAAAAGVRCAILSQRDTPEGSSPHFRFASYFELRDMLWR
jgi:phosphoglycolate phosphatase/putative hydrolase of the HAD superfamily